MGSSAPRRTERTRGFVDLLRSQDVQDEPHRRIRRRDKVSARCDAEVLARDEAAPPELRRAAAELRHQRRRHRRKS